MFNTWNGLWKTKTASATLTLQENLITATVTAAPAVFTLSTPSISTAGMEYTLVNRNSNQTVTVSPAPTIDQSGSGATIVNNTIAKFVYNGTIWIRLI